MGRTTRNPRWRMTVTVALLSGLLTATAGRVVAAPGDPDPSFGTGGKVLTDFGFGADANAMALQPDGRIITVGAGSDANGGNVDFALARYNANGALDPSFGTGGKVLTEFGAGGSGATGANAIVLQPDGRIIVTGLGYDANGNAGFALARYQGDGALDPSFGTGGKVLTDVGHSGPDSASAIAASAMVLQPDGQIVVAGLGYDASGNGRFALARYQGDGAP